MRPLLLLLMILAPAMSPVFGQKQLPASIQPYAVNWGYSLKQMFHAAGYDVPGPIPEYQLIPAIETRSDKPLLDSTVTYFGYDDNPLDTTPLLKNVYTYPQPDMEVVTEYFYDVDHWEPLSRTALFSDELGRLVDAFSQVYDDMTNTFLPDSRIVFYPYENSQTEADSFFVYGWAPELKDWHRLFATWNTFDGEGRLRESLTSTELFEFPIVFLDRYFYNNDNELTGIESFNIDGGEEFPASRESFWYTDHLLSTSIKSVSDGAGSFIDESRIEYTYTSSGQEELVKSFVMDFEKGEWMLNHVLGYVYDQEDRVSMQEIGSLNDNGNWDRQLDTYDYFVNEHLAVHSTFIFDLVGEEWIPQDKTFYYYNETTAYEPVDPTAIKELVIWPNPSSGYVRFELDADASVQLYGSSGQLIRQFEMAEGDMTIDVSVLQAGVYYVKAESNDVHYSGRLIVQ